MTHIITQAFGSYEVPYLTQAKKTIRNLTGKTNIDRMKVMLWTREKEKKSQQKSVIKILVFVVKRGIYRFPLATWTNIKHGVSFNLIEPLWRFWSNAILLLNAKILRSICKRRETNRNRIAEVKPCTIRMLLLNFSKKENNINEAIKRYYVAEVTASWLDFRVLGFRSENRLTQANVTFSQ